MFRVFFLFFYSPCVAFEVQLILCKRSLIMRWIMVMYDYRCDGLLGWVGVELGFEMKFYGIRAEFTENSCLKVLRLQSVVLCRSPHLAALFAADAAKRQPVKVARAVTLAFSILDCLATSGSTGRLVLGKTH